MDRNQTEAADAINEPSSVINRFPLGTVIHRRLAGVEPTDLPVSIDVRRPKCICGSECVMRART